MRPNNPEFSGHSMAILSSELPGKKAGSKPSRLSQLTRAIAARFNDDPMGTVIAGVSGITALYLAFQNVRAINNFNSPQFGTEENSNIIIDNTPVSFSPRKTVTDYLIEQLGYYGEVIPTGIIGMVTESEGIIVRYFPNSLGPRVETGQLEPFYLVHQAYQYNPRLINIEHVFRTKDGNFWVLALTEPDPINEGLRYTQVFALTENGKWLAKFVTEDGEVVPGEQLFSPAPQALAANK